MENNLHRAICLAAALAAAQLSYAQPSEPQTPSNHDQAPQAVAAVRPVLGTLKERTKGGNVSQDTCSLIPTSSTKSMPEGGMVVILRTVPCVSKYGSSRREFLEVLYSGKPRIVYPDSVFMTADSTRRFETISERQVDASTDEWRLASLTATLGQLERSVNAVKATAKHGIAILTSRIFDVSEHTEGTGFEVTAHNSGRKTIKYVTYSVVGLNAVNNPVRGGFGSSTMPMLRGIGPIEPGESATYSKDYMWSTDVVDSFRISQIKLEFTDGTRKVLKDIKSLEISAQDYEMLTAEDD